MVLWVFIVNTLSAYYSARFNACIVTMNFKTRGLDLPTSSASFCGMAAGVVNGGATFSFSLPKPSAVQMNKTPSDPLSVKLNLK